MDKVEKPLNEWEEEVLNPFLEKGGERDETFTTDSGIVVKRLVTPADVKFDYLKDIGFSGSFPFTRGVYPTMYRGRLWTIREYAGFGTANQTNKRYKYLVSQGTTGLSVAFDLPTQMGYDSDHELAYGEVGRTGVAIDSLEDMEVLFEGIDLSKISTSMTINSPAAILLAMYLSVAKKRGINPRSLRGTLQNDIIKEYAARGTYIFPPEPSMRLAVDTILFCKENMINFNPISISGYHMREAGATAVQELAFTLSSGISYVGAVMERGDIDVDQFASRLSFFFASHNNFFEEIAKFRAARRLWA
ncbi:MAG: methylmalonyl-CoA mutase family protein, partial [Candidatus Methanofastidiosia archaeon]